MKKNYSVSISMFVEAENELEAVQKFREEMIDNPNHIFTVSRNGKSKMIEVSTYGTLCSSYVLETPKK